MKFLALFALFVVASASEFSFGKELDEDWENFKKKFGKQYSGEEEKIRRSKWEQNVREIFHHNLKADLGTYTFRMGINKFADMSHEEFVQTYSYNSFIPSEKAPRNGSMFTPPPNAYVPESIDWRDHGLVTGVQDQGQCNSCYAFAATGALEGQHKKKTGNLVPLSKQEIVDCSNPPEYKNHGCGSGGGRVDWTFEYIQKNRGIDTEESYPYLGRESGQCRFQRSSVGATLNGFQYITPKTEDALKAAVGTVGPVAVVVLGLANPFQFYQSGIYNAKCTPPQGLTHAILAIGYGSENGQDYWIIKNSYGTDWGEKGFGRLARNQNNYCEIANDAEFPTV